VGVFCKHRRFLLVCHVYHTSIPTKLHSYLGQEVCGSTGHHCLSRYWHIIAEAVLVLGEICREILRKQVLDHASNCSSMLSTWCCRWLK